MDLACPGVVARLCFSRRRQVLGSQQTAREGDRNFVLIVRCYGVQGVSPRFAFADADWQRDGPSLPSTGLLSRSTQGNRRNCLASIPDRNSRRCFLPHCRLIELLEIAVFAAVEELILV